MVGSNVFPHWNSPVFRGCKHTEVLGASFEQLTISQWISLKTSGGMTIPQDHFCHPVLCDHSYGLWNIGSQTWSNPTSSKGLSHHLPAKNPCSKNWLVQKFLTYCRPCRIRKNGHPGCLWMRITIPTSQKRVCFQSMKKMIISQCHRNALWFNSQKTCSTEGLLLIHEKKKSKTVQGMLFTTILQVVLSSLAVFTKKIIQKNRNEPRNRGCLIRIRVMVYEIIPAKLGRMSSPTYTKQPGSFSLLSHLAILRVCNLFGMVEFTWSWDNGEFSILLTNQDFPEK